MGSPERPLVVLVDDDPEILRSVGRLLRHEPYDLLSTDKPSQVLEWAESRDVDLVVADQRMPEMNGTELLGILRQRAPRTLGVILSGYPETALIVEQSGLRIERLIAKPWQNDDLKDTLRRVLESRTKDGRSSARAPEEVVEVRMDCVGKTAGAVLAEIIPACRKAARQENARALILLENIRMLDDSLARLLKDLARAAVWLNLPMELRDSSGCVNAFLEAMDERAPTRADRREFGRA